MTNLQVPEKVIVHPLVLLSVVDHYNRVAKHTDARVVGVLLGEISRNTIDVTNSFAVPFEEDENDPTIWYLDHSYIEVMFGMFKKVNARERVVGWYSTGPKLKGADIYINDLIEQFCTSHAPVLVICQVRPKDLGLPIQGYYTQEEVKEDGTQKAVKVFANVATEVGQTEAEEIGVGHLLRDVKDATISTLASDIGAKVQAMRGLRTRLQTVTSYLDKVVDGSLPMNHEIMYKLQDIYSLLPNMNVTTLSRSLQVQCNDMMLAIYVATMIRTVLSLNNLIDNKETRLWKDKENTAPGQAAVNGASNDKAKEEKATNEGSGDSEKTK